MAFFFFFLKLWLWENILLLSWQLYSNPKASVIINNCVRSIHSKQMCYAGFFLISPVFYLGKWPLLNYVSNQEFMTFRFHRARWKYYYLSSYNELYYSIVFWVYLIHRLFVLYFNAGLVEQTLKPLRPYFIQIRIKYSSSIQFSFSFLFIFVFCVKV